MTPLRALGCAAGLLALSIAGCAPVGPDSVRRDRIDYAGAMADSWKQQTLLNVVRLRYADTPTFMDVSSVIASYALIGEASVGAAINTGVPENTTILPSSVVTAGAGGTFVNRPTISYTPLTGNKFTKSLLSPIPPDAIFSLIEAGYPADFLLQVSVRALNGVYNRSDVAGESRPADPEFYPLLDAMRRIQLSKSFSLRVEETEGKETVMTVRLDAHDPTIAGDIDYVVNTLKLSRGEEIILTEGGIAESPRELAVISRSMLEILHELAARIDVPEEHAAEGRTFANVALGSNVAPRDEPLVRIEAGEQPPAHAYAAVNYQGTWYWIDDRDYRSKNAFTFLLLFFALAQTGVQPQAPVLTLPVQ